MRINIDAILKVSNLLLLCGIFMLKTGPSSDVRDISLTSVKKQYFCFNHKGQIDNLILDDIDKFIKTFMEKGMIWPYFYDFINALIVFQVAEKYKITPGMFTGADKLLKEKLTDLIANQDEKNVILNQFIKSWNNIVRHRVTQGYLKVFNYQGGQKFSFTGFGYFQAFDYFAKNYISGLFGRIFQTELTDLSFFLQAHELINSVQAQRNYKTLFSYPSSAKTFYQALERTAQELYFSNRAQTRLKEKIVDIKELFNNEWFYQFIAACEPEFCEFYEFNEISDYTPAQYLGALKSMMFETAPEKGGISKLSALTEMIAQTKKQLNQNAAFFLEKQTNKYKLDKKDIENVQQRIVRFKRIVFPAALIIVNDFCQRFATELWAREKQSKRSASKKVEIETSPFKNNIEKIFYLLARGDEHAEKLSYLLAGGDEHAEKHLVEKLLDENNQWKPFELYLIINNAKDGGLRDLAVGLLNKYAQQETQEQMVERLCNQLKVLTIKGSNDVYSAIGRHTFSCMLPLLNNVYNKEPSYIRTQDLLKNRNKNDSRGNQFSKLNSFCCKALKKQ